ncbi:RNA polymerase, sigma 29 subunit, SigE [Gracilibacillus orientalis]|uniref:RNA polymerase sigma factor n=1 Tax=Gracilibacillus orientalis TaxID=334253 RepID=A0A1I4M9H2_9BACI|nr:RNA polymerase sporulation sigma factor SigE [Gracilibacillus orientalis]SFL99844.1 RNA polymerase, sigma 29 subunit, SigE [Gracilibacillus orientalis]
MLVVQQKYKMIFYKILKKMGFKVDEIYYIGGSEALPPPLSKEEEYELIHRLPVGDKAARAMLIERNLRLVVYIARKFENTGINIEDLISIGTIGLIKAINTFNPEKKIKLATYASRCIENEILMYLRKNNKIKTEVSFDEPLNVDWDGNELLLSDVLGTDEDVTFKDLEQNVDKSLLRKALEQLNGREKQIMELRFGLVDKEEEMTQKDVADLLGISQSYISRLEKKIIKRLQKEFNKMV